MLQNTPRFPRVEEAARSANLARDGRVRADAIGREMIELNAHISAAEARFLELLAEFDRDELWRCLSCHSAAQWLTWQCGLGEVAARERVRVARALEKLPKISAAYRRGEISYSKVRELTRVAQPQTEDSLLSIARASTAADVQRLVARHSRARRRDAAAQAVEQYRERHVRYRHFEDGTVLIEARLPVEIGEVVMKAIDAAVEALYRDAKAKKGLPVESSASSGSACTGADAADSAMHQLEIQEDVPAEARADGKAAPAFPSNDVTCTVGRGTPFKGDTESAAPDLLEPKNVPAETNLAPFGSGQRDGRQSFETEAAPHTSRCVETLGARRADALRLMAESFLSSSAGAQIDTAADRYQIVVHINQRLLAGTTEQVHDDIRAGSDEQPFARCELEDGQALALETARRLACDATLVGIIEDENGEPLNVGRRTRAISPALRRALRARDGGCRFPGCGRSRFTHGHHILHWAQGGETSLRNLVTLCTFHHTLVHEGGYSVARQPDGTFAFFAPDGERLPGTGRLDPRTIEALRRAAERGRVSLLELNLIDPAESGAAPSEAGRRAWAGMAH